jgi:hypothetical protein
MLLMAFEAETRFFFCLPEKKQKDFYFWWRGHSAESAAFRVAASQKTKVFLLLFRKTTEDSSL